MGLVVIPATPRAAQIQWTLKQPTQVNRSEWTGRRKVTVLAGAPRWNAQVAYPPILKEARIRPWRAFLALTQGQANSFRLIAVENQQIFGVAVLVNGGGQTGYALSTDGWGAAGKKLDAGSFVTINDQLLQVTQDVVADANGQAQLSFMPYLRTPPADNTVVVVDWPYALMSMAQDENGWTAGKGQQYSISFTCEESY